LEARAVQGQVPAAARALDHDDEALREGRKRLEGILVVRALAARLGRGALIEDVPQPQASVAAQVHLTAPDAADREADPAQLLAAHERRRAALDQRAPARASGTRVPSRKLAAAEPEYPSTSRRVGPRSAPGRVSRASSVELDD